MPYLVINLEGTPFDYNNSIIDSEINYLKVFIKRKN
jgi:hypothetical protein